MQITRKSNSSGIVRTMDLNTTPEELTAWKCGVPAQEAFPNLTADQREFIMTGITKEEWDEIFKEPTSYMDSPAYQNPPEPEL